MGVKQCLARLISCFDGLDEIMKRILISGLLLGVIIASGCGDPKADFVYISGSEHNQLDPQRMSWSHDIRLAHSLFETLVLLDFSDMSIHPGVAEQWTTSDDGLTYTFQLRDEARWSNGDTVTSHDFIYAWRRALLPDIAADYTKLFYHIEGAKQFFDWRNKHLQLFVKQGTSGSETADQLWHRTKYQFKETVGLSAPDDRTLVVNLAHRTPFFLELVAFVTFVPVHALSVEQTLTINSETGLVDLDSDYSTYWSDPDRLVTNGPYRLDQRKFKQFVHIVANEHYWNRDAMGNSSVLERIITDPQNAMLSYDGGGSHFWADVPSASDLAANLIQQNRSDVHLQVMAGTYFYNYNCLPQFKDGTPNPLVDPRVRRALSMAIDRKVLVERVTRLNQPVALSYIPVGVLKGYDPPVEEGLEFDPESARKLLAEAGYPGGEGLAGLSILYNTGHGHERPAQAIKRMWEVHLGVIVTLEGNEGKAFSERLKNQDYSIARASWYGDYPDPTTWPEKMTTNDGNNDCRWSNSEFDGLLEQAAVEDHPQRRLKILRDAEAVLLRDQPMALLYQYKNLNLFDPSKVKGLKPNAWHRWRLESVLVKP